MKEIDARGLACPEPVLRTRAAVVQEGAQTVKVIVDNDAARQNVCRFLASQDFEALVENEDGLFVITGRRRGQGSFPAEVPAETAAGEKTKILVMIATDRMGFGDDELGLKLMINFIKTLGEMGPELWRVILVNNGVKLAVDGSESLPALKALEEIGVKIMVCGTCLGHYHLLERKQAGETTNMLDIVTAMQLADKVINI